MSQPSLYQDSMQIQLAIQFGMYETAYIMYARRQEAFYRRDIKQHKNSDWLMLCKINIRSSLRAVENNLFGGDN